jgi:hypothetical protein
MASGLEPVYYGRVPVSYYAVNGSTDNTSHMIAGATMPSHQSMYVQHFGSIPTVDVQGIAKAAVESIKIEEIIKRIVESHARSSLTSLGGKTVSIPGSQITPMLESIQEEVRAEITKALDGLGTKINEMVQKAVIEIHKDVQNSPDPFDEWKKIYGPGSPYTIRPIEDPHIIRAGDTWVDSTTGTSVTYTATNSSTD